MPTLKQIVLGSVTVCVLFTTAGAQESTSTAAQRTTDIITAAAPGERVRITAPSSVVQLRVEVYATGGEKLLDQEIRGGNVFDWHLQDGQGQQVPTGNYICVVTAKSTSGKLSQRIGSIAIDEKSARVQVVNSQQLSPAQAQTIGPLEENSSWRVSGTEEPLTPTVIAHDGTDGQMIRGRGALTFRIGNFFTGLDQEQMRLTDDGRLGIGTSDPRATLDVAGTIRAQRFLVVKPNSSEKGKTDTDNLATEDPGASVVTGSGTQDHLAKWLNNAGALTDSGITEIAGNVGIGTTSPGSKLVVSANSSTLPSASGVARFADANGVQTAVFADSFGTNPIFNVRRANGTAAAPSAVLANQLLGVIGASGYGASTYTGTRARVGFFASENWTDTANGTYLTFNTTASGTAFGGGIERVRIDNAGKVGIGTTSPQELLNVNGNLRWGGTTTNFARSGQDGGGLYVEQQGDSAATSAARIQSSKSGNGTDYSQLVIDPTNGFSFNTTGTGNGNVGIGVTAPLHTLQIGGGSDAAFGLQASAGAPYAGAIRFGDGTGWSLVIGRARESSGGPLNTGNSGSMLTIRDNFGVTITSGQLKARFFSGGSLSVCRTQEGEPDGTFANCSSSLRYKTDVQPFAAGLELVRRLRPISFTWKIGGMLDLGLAAEDVARVEPRLVTYAPNGDADGVKYDRLSAVFINAFKQQQAQIQQQQNLLERLQTRLTRLERSNKQKRAGRRRLANR